MKKIKRIILRIKKTLKQRKCNHDWKNFDSGYKQCKKCFKIDKI